MNEPLTLIPYLTIDQPGGTFYCCKTKAKNIAGKLFVRRRTIDGLGVQRDLDTSRAKDIAAYMATPDAIIPTPLVISVRLAENILDTESNRLIIPQDSDGNFGEIIDGQHRYAGLERTNAFADQDILLCIFFELSIEDKATLFSTINSTQVKVPKSYIYDLFEYSDKKSPIKFCHKVCRALQYQERGPLFRRIKMLGKKLDSLEMLSQAALIDAILPLVSDGASEVAKLVQTPSSTQNAYTHLPLRELYDADDVVTFSKMFANFLDAIAIVAPESWERFFLKSIGIKVAGATFGLLVPRALEYSDFSISFFERQLLPAKIAIEALSTQNAGTNRAAQRTAVNSLKAALEIKS